jgi:tetratricopeptide (TPR) repeat protein
MPRKTLPAIRGLMTKAFALSLVSLFVLHLTASAEINIPATYEEALSSYRAGSYTQALGCLNKLEPLALKPSTRAEVHNLRAVILMRGCDYEAAETNLRAALELAPSLSNAKFNLGEIAFLEQDWAEARSRFERILAEEGGDLDTEVRQLIRFKIFLTYLLERNDAAAGELIKTWEETSPMSYYGRAAIVRNRGAADEARKWLEMAETKFGEGASKLYRESFYEIGWERRPAAQARKDFGISSAAERASRKQLEAERTLAHARTEVSSGHLDKALASIARVEEQLPSEGFSNSLRAEILIKENKLDEAESELCTALELNPNLHGAAYNLASIYFKRRQFSLARDELEKLYASATVEQSQQFLKYKVFLTLLLEGSDDQAELMMNRFTYTAETPALYYARAAWSFQHGAADRGQGWVETAERLYSPALNLIFVEDFYQLQWLTRTGNEVSSPEAASIVPVSSETQSVPLEQLNPTH